MLARNLTWSLLLTALGGLGSVRADTAVPAARTSPDWRDEARMVVVDRVAPVQEERVSGWDGGTLKLRERVKFPAFSNPTRDPVRGTQYERVIYGPTEKVDSWFSNYSYRRYVTVYSVTSQDSEITDLPRIHQSCFDGGRYPIGSWRVTRSIEVSLSSTIKAGEMGLSAEISTSISQGRQYEIQRNVTADIGLVAEYIPVLSQETWEGVTFVQVYEPKTGYLGYLTPSWWESFRDSYPYDFRLTNAATSFRIDRDIKRQCQPGEMPKASPPPPELSDK